MSRKPWKTNTIPHNVRKQSWRTEDHTKEAFGLSKRTVLPNEARACRGLPRSADRGALSTGYRDNVVLHRSQQSMALPGRMEHHSVQRRERGATDDEEAAWNSGGGHRQGPRPNLSVEVGDKPCGAPCKTKTAPSKTQYASSYIQRTHPRPQNDLRDTPVTAAAPPPHRPMQRQCIWQSVHALCVASLRPPAICPLKAGPHSSAAPPGVPDVYSPLKASVSAGMTL